MNINFKFNNDGLIPAIVQQSDDSGKVKGRVLMMAWMNKVSIQKTFESGFMHYWSRSRQSLWLKGESSGHKQKVIRWYVDCDRDTLLFEVEQEGGACHTGYQSCFFQSLNQDGSPMQILEPKIFDPKLTYH